MMDLSKIVQKVQLQGKSNEERRLFYQKQINEERAVISQLKAQITSLETDIRVHQSKIESLVVERQKYR